MGIIQTDPCQSCRHSMTAARGRTAVFCLQGGAGSVFSCAAGTTAFVKQTRSQPRLRGCSRGLGCCPNKQKQRFPAAPGTAVSSLCGNKGTACEVAKLSPHNLLQAPFMFDNLSNTANILFIHSGGVLQFCIRDTTTAQ